MEIKIAAYVKLLGIGTEAMIDVSNKGFRFFVYGNLFNLIEANVTVSAAYGKGNVMGASFEVCMSAC